MSSPASPLRRLLTYSSSQKNQVYLASLFSFLNKAFDIAPEILIGVAIDVVAQKENSFLSHFGYQTPWEQIVVLSIITLCIWICESLFEYLHLIYWRGLAQDIEHHLRIDTYSHIQNLDVSYFEDKSTGNLVSILNDDINQLERFLDGGANQLIQTAVAVVGVGAVFFYLSPDIAMVAFLPVPVIIIGAFYFQKRALPLYANVREKVGLLSQRLSNNISGILTIKSYTQEAYEADRLKQDSLDYLNANKKAIAFSSAFIPVIRMAILCGFVATFLWGGYKVLNGELRVGAYGVLVFLTQRLLWPLTGLATTMDLYERAMASSRRILDLLQTPIQMQPGHKTLTSTTGHYTFKNVNFQYASSGKILNNINLEISPGKTTAIVGSTGSGKSTLLKLLFRFYEPTSGAIILDNEPLHNYNISDVRRRIGYVSQDIFLFHGTVKENILYGNMKASSEELINASKLAEAHEFIMALPHGYDTVIGERGQKLSGGQRQRLSLARAILKNPDVLILDEATSAVDNDTEAAIQRSLAKVTKNRTTIIIAHRLSTIVHADRIYVLDRGNISESGTHSELLTNKHHYYHFWNVQTGQQIHQHL
ncbi:MAG: ABC transporter ATP-binding protein [Bdellovibrionaceae bacterium]|nr:ABC transporter ATP-binding protein [Pseudobdellovibrionaceae bacterium]